MFHFFQRYDPFKNGPSVGGSCGDASLSTKKHEVQATLSSVDLNSHFILTYRAAEYILSIKISKRLPRWETLIYYDFVFYPSPQKCVFFLPVENLITAGGKT